MKKDEAQNIVNDFYKKHRSLNNNGHKIIVIDYPQDYNEELRGQIIKGIHRASNNDTYIIASEHENKEDLLKTIKHEMYGHYGLNTLPQENKIDILLSVVRLQDTALKDEWQQVRYDYPDMKEFRQAEEVFCSVVSEVITTPEFQHSFNETLESKKEIQDVGKYIKMTLQTGDAKQLIVPENNDLQFNKSTENELDEMVTPKDRILNEKDTTMVIRQGEIKEIPKNRQTPNEVSFESKKEAIIYQVASGNTHNFTNTDKKTLADNFEEITSKAYKKYPDHLKEINIEILKENIETLENSTLKCIQKINEMKVEDADNKNIEKLEGVVKDILLENTKNSKQLTSTLETLHHSDTKTMKDVIKPKNDISSTEANSKDLYKHKKDSESDNYERRY